MTPNRFAAWFGRALWLAVFVNLGLAVPGLFTPSTLSTVFGLGNLAPGATVGLRTAGMLVVLVCGFYVLAAGDPLGSLSFSRWAVACQFLAAAFWAWVIIGLGLSATLWWIFGIELALGLVFAFLLFRALAVTPPPVPKPWRRSLFDRTYGWIIRRLEALGILWYKLRPPLLGSVGTGGLRRELRAYNLYSTPGDVPDDERSRVAPGPDSGPPHPLPAWDPAYRDNRAPDGSHNDLENPAMGMTGMRFGRNMPLADVDPVVPPEGDPAKGVPSPRAVSVHLLARARGATGPTFIPATTLNLLAAAWIQFQNHGWFNHRILEKMPIDPHGAPVPEDPANFIRVPLAHDDPWVAETGQTEMRIRRSISDPTRPAGAAYPPTFRNTESHWWDASQIYGADCHRQAPLRSGSDGKVRTEGDGEGALLPLDPDAPGIDLTGFNNNYWLGLSLLHTLFVREHNFLCDQLKARYASRLEGIRAAEADEWLFGKARLIVAGLMAKIHTIEWTPGILGNPRLRIDMNSNWWGALGRWFKIHVGRVSANEGISGIIGSQAEQHAAPFAMTEEFVSVYRLHPLIPDEVKVYELAAGGAVGAMKFEEVQGKHTRAAALRHSMTDWFYSFGKQHPGAITLRNYPDGLRRFERTTGEVLDLATRDIARDRERGIPRYNRFRELLRMKPVASFEELVGPQHADRTELVATLKKLYGEDGINRVDLMVGLFAEPLPPGFGFSDTAFRIFILMASRRLKSDRFFTDDFRPEVYTPFGIEWLNEQTMQSLLERHYPRLRGQIPADRNTFAPW